MKSKVLFAALTASVFWAAYASAGIVFTPGNSPQPDEANILFGSKETGATITGEVDHTGVAANFSTLTNQTLVQNSNGQADISANGKNVDLTSIEFFLDPGFFFNDFIMNLSNGTGTALVTVKTQNATDSFALGNGQNFLTITTTGGDLMTSISVTMENDTGGWKDFKQPRVSGVCEVRAPEGPCVPLGVELPEPATLLLLALGFGGLGLTRRRKTS